MPRNDKADPPRGEERLDRAKKNHDEAWAIIGQEREAMRKKTERLRQLRLAKEAEVDLAILDRKPPTVLKTGRKSTAKRPAAKKAKLDTKAGRRK